MCAQAMLLEVAPGVLLSLWPDARDAGGGECVPWGWGQPRSWALPGPPPRPCTGWLQRPPRAPGPRAALRAASLHGTCVRVRACVSRARGEDMRVACAACRPQGRVCLCSCARGACGLVFSH